MFIDAHCHLADPRLESELEGILERSRKDGIGKFIQGGVGPEDWEAQLALVKRFPGVIFPSFGLHPWWVAAHSREECEAALTQLPLYMDRGVGVGELGLDHAQRCPEETWERQRVVFERQLALARGRPLILHVVRAHAEVFAALGKKSWSGIVHAFGGNRTDAERYLALGLTISVGGTLAREGHETLKRAVAAIPLERLVIESDSPDQPPPAYRGRLNEPSSIRDVAAVVAAIKQVDPDRVLEQSRANLEGIFKL